MNLRNRVLRMLLVLIGMVLSTSLSALRIITDSFDSSDNINLSLSFEQQDNEQSDKILSKLNSKFLTSISSGDTSKSRSLVNSIKKHLEDHKNPDLTSSTSRYYIGVFCLWTGDNQEAVNWFRLSLERREQMKCFDEIYAKCLYNLGIAFNNLGDIKLMEDYMVRSLDVETKLYGDSDPVLLRTLSALVAANLNLNEYFRAIGYGNRALKLITATDEKNNSDIADLYTNIGVSYAQLSDYTKAVLYLEQAEAIHSAYKLAEDGNYINLLNSLAVTYFFLGRKDKADEYFNKGLEKIRSSNSPMSFNFLNSFAIMLGKAGEVKRGEDLLLRSLQKAKVIYGSRSREYFEVLKNYADYLRTLKKEFKESLNIYEKCIEYVKNHPEDLSLGNPVYLGYARALSENGNSRKALEIIQKLLYSGLSDKANVPEFKNPGINLIEPGQWSIDLLRAKYKILWDIYRKQKNDEYLFISAETSELIIALLEKVRINISEDESRLILGDRFRDSYLNAIRDFDLCFKATGDKKFLEKAFRYSEKSKVAGLLASTRELKASQFHIPADIAESERILKTEIGFYNARISEENSKPVPDAAMISEWKERLISATQRRDSLICIFENKYPEYYLLKYNTEVIKPGEIPAIAGRNTNYLNYVLSDSILYIFLSNRKQIQLLTVPVDSGFFSNMREFRNLLAMPQNDARSDFIRYNTVGSDLCRKIFEPVKKYLISDKLLISADNILSYIPFEAIPDGLVSNDNSLYNEINYLMNDFSISYTYSATFLAESEKKNASLVNSLIAFAPKYRGSLNVDSIMESRHGGISVLKDLPFARMEAEFVTDLTGGRLYANNSARESVFKSEAGKYDIIHLAMHTILNDQYPMYSKMLFYQGRDSVEDGSLNTYEVYGVPLKAKMVILSSCNTGTGKLSSGEGIQSLARGFIYSGGQSVVMSMWEIEDRSGTEIVESFYRYLKRGYTKSNALRKARTDYLKNADMLRSHPYFWASLVVYGNNTPLYYPVRLVLITGASFLLVCGLLIQIYLKSRRS